MYRFYRSIRRVTTNLIYWLLDYAYISRQQIVGFFNRRDVKMYLNSDTKKPPILLIPGIYERWHFMKPIADLLYRHGYSVHIVESLGYNAGSVEIMAELVEDYIQRANIRDYSIVAHSKGGLVAKYLLLNEKNTIRRVIAINTPFGGSKYAGLFPLGSIRSFMPNSAILTLLATDKLSNKKITSIYGLFDPHIPNGSYLDGAKNIQLQTRGHFLPVKYPDVHTAILNSLQNP